LLDRSIESIFSGFSNYIAAIVLLRPNHLSRIVAATITKAVHETRRGGMAEASQIQPQSSTYGLRREVLSPMETLAQSISTIAPTTTPVATIPLVCALAGNGTWLAYVEGGIGDRRGRGTLTRAEIFTSRQAIQMEMAVTSKARKTAEVAWPVASRSNRFP
jgi:hypothetical protein